MMCEKTTKSENPLFQKAFSFFIKEKIMEKLPYLKKKFAGKSILGKRF